MEQADLLGVARLRHHPVVVPGPPLALRLALLEGVPFPGVRQAGQGAGEGRGQENQADPPVEGEEQGGDADQGDAVLSDLHQPVHDARRAVRGFLLRPVQGVEVPGILVVPEVDGDRLRVEQVGDVVRHRLGLGLRGPLPEGAAQGRRQGRAPGEKDPEQGLLERDGLVRRLESRRRRVDDPLHQVEDGQGKQALQQEQREVERGPPGGALPHEAHRPVQAQAFREGFPVGGSGDHGPGPTFTRRFSSVVSIASARAWATRQK